jgi:leader peptidase (prepilin peptidase) / N-methyltransferase
VQDLAGIWGQASAALFGACLGSFVNVLIHRLPREESIVWPSSRCPRCRKAIAFYDNVPILSWLWLRARCRRCKGRISARYPLVEAVVAALALLLWRRWAGAGQPFWPPIAALAAGALVAVTIIDWDTFLIPDELSLGLLALGLACAPLNPLFAGAPWWQAYLWAARGAAAGFALCYGTAAAGEALFGKEAMGGGDIKLLAAVGAWSGVLGAFDCLMIGSLLGSAYGVALIARGRLKRADPIPFGPFLSAGAIVNLFVVFPLGFPFV